MKVFVVIGYADYLDHYESDISSIQVFRLRGLAEEYKIKLINLYGYDGADIIEKEFDD